MTRFLFFFLLVVRHNAAEMDACSGRQAPLLGVYCHQNDAAGGPQRAFEPTTESPQELFRRLQNGSTVEMKLHVSIHGGTVQ